MPRTVLLRHDLPDGTWHYDWLLARADPPGAAPSADDRVLVAFRVAKRPDGADRWAMDAHRLPDHRALYLTYEGPVSGNRGSVRRELSGACEVTLDGPDRAAWTVRFDAGAWSVGARRVDDAGRWRLEGVRLDAPSGR